MNTIEGLNAVFLYATEGILVVNDAGEIIRINPSAEKLFGYQKDELLGQPIEVLIPKHLTSAHEKHRHNYSKHPHARSMGEGKELFGLKKDGITFPLEISLSPYTFKEKKYVVAFVIDITLRKQAEEKLKIYSSELEQQVKNRTLILEEAIEELEKTKKDLHQALDKERDLNELKSRFVSMASHEFRTPLTTMLSSLSLVDIYNQKGDVANHSKHVSKIKNAITNLTDILNDFLSLSKIEEGKVENKPEFFNFKTLLHEIVTDMCLVASRQQRIVSNYKGQEEVNLDKKLVKNILFNLISNAIKFSPDGGEINIAVNTEAKSLSIQVKDEGIGISVSDQKHLFERFFRGYNATHIQGTGLGLNIVARYVELMRGSITVNSEENKGTSFLVKLPQ